MVQLLCNRFNHYAFLGIIYIPLWFNYYQRKKREDEKDEKKFTFHYGSITIICDRTRETPNGSIYIPLWFNYYEGGID